MKQMIFMDVCSVEINFAHFCWVSFLCHIATILLVECWRLAFSKSSFTESDSHEIQEVEGKKGPLLLAGIWHSESFWSHPFAEPLRLTSSSQFPYCIRTNTSSFLDFPHILALLLCQISTLLAAFQFLYQTHYLYVIHSDSCFLIELWLM